jgi:hypothetical protein
MSNYNFRGYRSASSRFIGNEINGVKVEAVLAKNGAGSSTDYIAICRLVNRHGGQRVLSYNHVVQAAAGTINLRIKYDAAPTLVRAGLVSRDEPVPAIPVAVPNTPVARTLVGAIQNSANTTDLDNLDLAGALLVMNKLIEAAKRDKNIANLVKLVALTNL